MATPKGKTCDPFAIVTLDKKEFRTPVVSNNPNPFWAEDFCFEDVEEKFNQLTVTLFSKGDEEEDPDIPIGQVSLPRAALLSGQLDEDQWFALAPVDQENTVNGELRVKIVHTYPAEEGESHTLAVNIVSAKDLIPRTDDGTANSFVVMHLLPDLQLKSTKRTHNQPDTLSPNYRETFIYKLDNLDPDMELHFSVWNAGATPAEDFFMGQITIPIGSIGIPNMRSDKWYTLLPKPVQVGNLAAMFDKKVKKKADEDVTKAKLLVHAHQALDLEWDDFFKAKKPHKFSETKFTSMTYCAHCCGMMWAGSNEMQCKECRLNCHSRCSKFIAKHCGDMSLIRLRIKLLATPVLALEKYEKFISILTQDDYSLCTLLGLVTQEREEAARSLIRIFEQRGQVIAFLKSSIRNEVLTAPDSATMFRANSMASKSIDVYMKFVGLPYLRSVLKPIVTNIHNKGISAEVDPTRLSDKKKDELESNWKLLKGYMQAVVHAIFSNSFKMPIQFRDIFHELQQLVQGKFLNDPIVRYTSISGFIFLRFFAPAILGPKLFGLIDQHADDKTARTFTLLAKTLQNLANLVEFGQKEAYMLPMNEFINAKMGSMKDFIDDIASVDDSNRTKKFTPFAADAPQVNMAHEAAHVFEIVVRATEKLVEQAKPHQKPLVAALIQEMSGVMLQLDDFQFKSGAHYAKIKAFREDARQIVTSMDDISTTEVVLRKHKKETSGSSIGTPSSAKNRMSITETLKQHGSTLKRTMTAISMVNALKSRTLTPATLQKSSSTSSATLSGKRSPSLFGSGDGGDELQRDLLIELANAQKSHGDGPNKSNENSPRTSQQFDPELVEQPLDTGNVEEVKAVEKRKSGSRFKLPIGNIFTRSASYDSKTPPRPPSRIDSSIDKNLVHQLQQVMIDGVQIRSRSRSPSKSRFSDSISSDMIDAENGPPLSPLSGLVLPLPPSSPPMAAFPPAPSSPPPVHLAVNTEPLALPISPLSSPLITVPNMGVFIAASKKSPKRGKPACDICGFPIEGEGDLVAAFGKFWHSAHFVCCTCNTSLVDDHRKKYVDGRLYCRDHAPTEQSTESEFAARIKGLKKTKSPVTAHENSIAEEKQTASGSSVKAPTDTLINQEQPVVVLVEAQNAPTQPTIVYEPQPSVASITCVVCQNPIHDGAQIEAGNNPYHTECFKCSDCRTALDPSDYSVFENQIYCKADYNLHAGPSCSLCNDQFTEGTEDVIEFQGRKYHKHCKRCDYCLEPLTSKQFIIVNNSVMCQEHQSVLVNCHGCKDYITGPTVLTAMKKQHQYHPEHFTCIGCNKILSKKQFFEKADQPWCVRCFFAQALKDLKIDATP